MADICLFSAHYLPHIGGIERYTYYMAKWLVRRGNRVTVVTSDLFDGLPQTEESADGVTIRRMPCYRLMNGRYPVLKRNATFRRLDRELRQKRFDLVVVNARFYVHSLYGASYARRIGAKCITIEHGSAHLTVNNAVLDFFGRIYEHAITVLLRTKCKDYYAVSEAAARWSRHFGIVSKGVLYNSVDVSEIAEKAACPVMDYRETYHLSSSDKLISFAGRLVSGKGAKELIEAVKRMDGVTLLIAGDGPDRREVEQAAQGCGRITLLGNLDFDHVIALMKASDVFCFPTGFVEGLPTSVLEAAACDTFVVATGLGGTAEILPDDSYGYVMKDNRADTIYRALSDCLDDPAYRESCRKNSKERVSRLFNWSETVKNVERIASGHESFDHRTGL